MVRSSSCPGRVTRTPDAAGPPLVANLDLSNSNGCGGDSPTGYRAFARIWLRLLKTMITFMPVARVQMWMGRIYVMVDWHPSGSPSILRPRMWHTTLVRARVKPSTGAAGLMIIQNALSHAMNAMLAPMRGVNGAVHARLSFPPWKASWNDGLPSVFERVCEALMHMGESMLIAHNADIEILERRPHHISWNV